MVSTNEKIAKAYDPIRSDTLTVTSGSASTTPAKVITGSATGREKVWRVRVKNLHATQDLALLPVDTGASAPTFSADGTSDDGIIDGAGDEPLIFFLRGDQDLYIVASGASTGYNLAYW